jgi:hypothetical protein
MEGLTACEARWKEVLTSFNSQADELLAAHPDPREVIEMVHPALVTIRQLVHAAPRVNGNSEVWMQLADRAEAEKRVLCKHLEGKYLFTGMLRLHALTHREMRDSLLNTRKGEPAQDNEEFREQKGASGLLRRKNLRKPPRPHLHQGPQDSIPG